MTSTTTNFNDYDDVLATDDELSDPVINDTSTVYFLSPCDDAYYPMLDKHSQTSDLDVTASSLFFLFFLLFAYACPSLALFASLLCYTISGGYENLLDNVDIDTT